MNLPGTATRARLGRKKAMIFKRLVALILCLLLVLGLLTISISVLADDAQEPAGVSYYINSLEDLLAQLA